jgi:hypothetical protein
MLAAQTNAAFWQFLVEKKDAFGTIETILKCLGILAAGWWAYWHFILKREKYPRGDLEHKIQFSRTSKDEWHVRVNLRVKNDSAVLMRIFEGHTWIQQIHPYPEEAIVEFKERNKDSETTPREVRWPLICEKRHNDEREVEPGEVDEIAMDFFVSTFFEKILVYSFIENTTKPGRNLGWMTSTIIDFTKPDGAIIDQGQGQTQDKPRPNSARK